MSDPGRLLRHALCLLALLLGSAWLAGPVALQPPGHWCRHDLYRVLRTSFPWP